MTGVEFDPTMQRVVEMLRSAEISRRAETSSAAPGGTSQDSRKHQARLLLADNRALVAPYGWITAADVVAFAAHYPAHALGWWGPFATIATACAAVAARTFWHVRPSRLGRVVKTARTRRAIARDARIAVIAGTLWELLAGLWTPIGHPYAFMQLALLGGGLAIATPHLRRNRRRIVPAEPVAEIEAPKEDPRLALFREHFCRSGALREARLDGFETVKGGFAFEVECAIQNRGTFKDVLNLQDAIAALYDIPPDHVAVEPPKNRSHRRARITVLTDADAHEREERWDGKSTYDPATGCFKLGRFADSTGSRWQLHVPYSGAAGGIAAGKIGSGKTGTLHVIACEAGQAKLCADCLGERSCETCDMRRIAAVWIGDPQQQPFGVYRGKADLTAWGPLACVRMLYWLHTAGRNRAAQMGQMEWTDHLGRTNFGKGWFDPEPGLPLIVGIIDEWPMITDDPEIGPFAVSLAVDILAEFRKVGITLVIGAQQPDVDILGERGIREALTAFNTIVHRTDRYAKQMLEIEGDPTQLAPGIPGLSYLNGIDRRSGTTHRTKSIREYLRKGETGVDVREIVDRIAADPIVYDDAFLNAITSLGYTGPGQVLSDEDAWGLSELLPKQDTAKPTPKEWEEAWDVIAQLPPSSSVSQENIRHVAEKLRERNGDGSDVYDLMQDTRMSALDVTRAVDALIAAGAAAQTPSGRYVPCA